ncbi:hypothetical protein [Gluconobacter thailandicus]|jgi:glyceraldehyde-3-phosphate dehydrogenase/erythrose-4-phosphate dehydrogenase|nr:hypothetical protein [Gluconobacter thailandicus]GAN90428.1 hypothetical protein Gbfr_016_009 [Gluconobacter frateurii M-2]GBR60419.1 hypothetical protein AA100600_1993 [Gluconobacter thailandicus F149-1 = NBRC 100600]
MSYDENGTDSEIRELVRELQTDAEQLNIMMNKSGASEDLKHMIAALADKIDGLTSLVH